MTARPFRLPSELPPFTPPKMPPRPPIGIPPTRKPNPDVQRAIAAARKGGK